MMGSLDKPVLRTLNALYHTCFTWFCKDPEGVITAPDASLRQAIGDAKVLIISSAALGPRHRRSHLEPHQGRARSIPDSTRRLPFEKRQGGVSANLSGNPGANLHHIREVMPELESGYL